MVNACVAVPANEISLSDAFQHILCATKSNIQELMDRLVQVGCSNAEPGTDKHSASVAVWHEYDRTVQTSDQQLRDAISQRRITPLITVKGERQSLGCQDWENPGPLYGVASNFTGRHRDCTPGPSSEVDGKFYAAFFRRDEFDSWFESKFPTTDMDAPSTAESARRRRAGKGRGDGSYADVDSPRLDEMTTLLRELKAASPEEAACKVADRAHGSGTFESKVDRLAKRYRKIHRAT